MKLSEIGLMMPVLCKHAGSSWSDIFEITKLGYSSDKKAVYIRNILGASGAGTSIQHYWRDVEDLDKKFEVFDTI